MIPKVTQDNIYLLLPGKAANVATIYADETGTPYVKALATLYASNTYRQLEQEHTKYWHLGPVALYEILRDELNNGKKNENS